VSKTKANEPAEEDSTASRVGSSDIFATTHWSAVMAAARSDPGDAREALGRLYQIYTYPLYLYVRRRGHSPEDAQDLIQEFFARLLERNWLDRADQEKGRFRSFLLGAVNHFLANEWDKRQAWKRGGRLEIVPLQFDTAEGRYREEPVDTTTPEQCYERRWAVALLDAVMTRLQEEHESRGEAAGFNILKPCLLGDAGAQPYAVLASKTGRSEGAIKVAIHRLRQRYRQLLREEIGRTVASPDEVEAEMRHLFAVLARR
jgi:RNA polymerase sigma-70 factor (ECF subfamily)